MENILEKYELKLVSSTFLYFAKTKHSKQDEKWFLFCSISSWNKTDTVGKPRPSRVSKWKIFWKNKNWSLCPLLFYILPKHSKHDEKWFLFYSISSWDIQFLQLFPFHSAVCRLQVSDETRITMMSWIALHNLTNVIFGKTQKTFCIKLWKLPR